MDGDGGKIRKGGRKGITSVDGNRRGERRSMNKREHIFAACTFNVEQNRTIDPSQLADEHVHLVVTHLLKNGEMSGT